MFAYQMQTRRHSAYEKKTNGAKGIRRDTSEIRLWTAPWIGVQKDIFEWDGRERGR